MKHRCDLKHELKNAVILAPFIFLIVYAVAPWPDIMARLHPEHVEAGE